MCMIAPIVCNLEDAIGAAIFARNLAGDQVGMG